MMHAPARHCHIRRARAGLVVRICVFSLSETLWSRVLCTAVGVERLMMTMIISRNGRFIVHHRGVYVYFERLL